MSVLEGFERNLANVLGTENEFDENYVLQDLEKEN